MTAKKRPTGATEITLRVDAPMLARIEREAEALNRGGHGRPASLEYACLMILRSALDMNRRSETDGVGFAVPGRNPPRD